MKKHSLLFIAFCLFCFAAQSQVITNVDWELSPEEDKINISYELAKEGKYSYFDISVTTSVGGNIIIPTALSGDVGKFIKAGKDKKIVWDVFQDVSELSGELTVEVIAHNPVTVQTDAKPELKETKAPKMETTQPKVPYWAGLGGIGAAGLGLLIAGVKVESDSKELYDIYVANRRLSDAIYTELDLSRDELYDDANKKHKSASLVTAGGAAILLTAGVMIVNRMIQSKKIANRNLSLRPSINPEHKSLAGKPETSYGLTLTYKIK